MALSDIRDFYYYTKYLWSAGDFTNFQTWIKARIEGFGEGFSGGGILSGLRCTPGGGLNVSVPAGIGLSPSGKLLVSDATALAAVASPVGNPAWSLIVLRPTNTDLTLIPEPLNPANNVPLHKKTSYTLTVLNGTPAVSPSYPTPDADDLVIMGVKLTAGHVTIASTDLDPTPVNFPRPRRKAIAQKSVSYNLTERDEIVEMNCTGGTRVALLPIASTVPNQEFLIRKTDSSANVCTVSGTEPIDGVTSIDLEDQYQSVKVYSNGLTYGVI